MKVGNKWKQIILFSMILVTCSLFNILLSQNLQQKPSRQSSMEAYSRGNYEEAYREFRELLKIYSKDPLYKYYSGVCLIKLNRNPSEAEMLLKEALQSASVVKSLPSDALFYLGSAQQKSGNFDDAILSFNQYTQQVGKKVAKEQNVPVLIQQCKDKQGKTAIEASPSKNELIAQETKAVSNAAVPKAVVINPVINKNIPVSADLLLGEALIYQSKADSLSTLAENQKKQFANLPPSEKNSSNARISEIEISAASFQKLADQKYDEAQAIMNPQKITAAEATVVAIAGQGVRVDTVTQSKKAEVDSKSELPDNKQNNATGAMAVTETIAKSVINKPVEVYSVFEVLAQPVIGQNEKISIDPVVPDGLIYRIQVAVFRNPVTPAYFKGITPVYGFKIAGTDKTTYYLGMFRRSSDATKALATVKSKGFKDSFIVALLNGKAVSSDRATVLEKEWGKAPLMVTISGNPDTTVDTIPPTLAFRVEVLRSTKPLKDAAVQEITKMAGNRGLDKQIIDGGQVAYLIGRFITFESAAEYADLLIRNGYKEAKVVAWLGKKEIPVETARQLFDNTK